MFRRLAPSEWRGSGGSPAGALGPLQIPSREADSLPKADPTNHFDLFKVIRAQMLVHSCSLLIKGTRCGANDLPWQQKTCSRIFVG